MDGTKTVPFLLQHDPPFSRNTDRDDGKVCWGPDGGAKAPARSGWPGVETWRLVRMIQIRWEHCSR